MGSFLNKLVTYDPLNAATGGKFNKYATDATKIIDPIGGTILGKLGNYSSSSGPGTPGPYAGVTPTLADAAAGYVKASGGSNVPSPQVAANNSVNNIFGGQQQGQPKPIRPINPNPTIGATPPASVYG